MSLMTAWNDHRMSETCLEQGLLVQRLDNNQKVTLWRHLQEGVCEYTNHCQSALEQDTEAQIADVIAQLL